MFKGLKADLGNMGIAVLLPVPPSVRMPVKGLDEGNDRVWNALGAPQIATIRGLGTYLLG